MLDKDSARKLATRVVKESEGGIIKFGRTNGRNCLHIRVPAKPPAGDAIGAVQSAQSITIYSEFEWDESPLNVNNKPRKKKVAEDDLVIRDAIANREAQ